MDALRCAVEDELDAFLLDPGMGPMTYLTRDGRIAFDHRSWDGGGLTFAETMDDVIPALVVGAKKTGLAELLTLIPTLVDAQPCPKCEGRRWSKPTPSFNADIVCIVCSGRGEVDAHLLATAKHRG